MADDAIPTAAEVAAIRHGMNCPARTPGNDEECTCGLVYRDRLATEQTMHAAWRKRAEEAEIERDALRADNERLRAAMDASTRHVDWLYRTMTLGPRK